ncbi:MAG: FtsW/RodA/SpoVE family cell cycle protein, partial [Candidatus Hydrogenedentota bacterium]
MRLRKPEEVYSTSRSSNLRMVLDPYIVLPAVTIFVFSLCALYSVVYHPIAFEIQPDLATDFSTPFVKHLVWGLLGLAGMTWFAFSDLEKVRGRTVGIYAGGILLLVLVLVPGIGLKIRNIRAWISLGFITFQPSEIVKIVLVLSAARFLSSPSRESKPLISLLSSAVLVGVPAALVLKQPDMGTVIVFLSLLLTLPFAAGLPSQYLVLILVSCILAGVR